MSNLRDLVADSSFRLVPTRHFMYVSDTKVDMLLAQIPQSQKQKIAIELKLDLKLLRADPRTHVAC